MNIHREHRMLTRGLLLVALVALLAVTAMRGEAARRGIGFIVSIERGVGELRSAVGVVGHAEAPAASRETGNAETIFQISPDGQLLQLSEAAWIPVVGLPGRVTTVAASGAGTVYAGTDVSGLMKSTDNGATWQAVNNVDLGQVPGSVLGITALMVNPSDTEHVVVATGYWLGTSQAYLAPHGIFESADGGQTWHTLTTGRLPGKVVELRLDPAWNTVTARWEAAGELVVGLSN